VSLYLYPVAFTIFVWWFSTGAILYLDGLPRRTFPWTMLAATGVLALAMYGLYSTASDTRVIAAYVAFGCAIMVWAWQEIAFLLGYVTGPMRSHCPAQARGWKRAGWALLAVLHHELALVALALAVAILTWGGENQTGWWTFLVLWVMRQSAKLNIFLGARNLSESFLPAHLKYLQSYFRRRTMNALFPFSVVGSGLVAVLTWQAAVADGVTAFDAVALTFAATLLTLALVEHIFMMLPLPSEKLWSWGMRSRGASPVEVRDSSPL